LSFALGNTPSILRYEDAPPTFSRDVVLYIEHTKTLSVGFLQIDLAYKAYDRSRFKWIGLILNMRKIAKNENKNIKN
jgi:hypothetical protein